MANAVVLDFLPLERKILMFDLNLLTQKIFPAPEQAHARTPRQLAPVEIIFREIPNHIDNFTDHRNWLIANSSPDTLQVNLELAQKKCRQQMQRGMQDLVREPSLLRPREKNGLCRSRPQDYAISALGIEDNKELTITTSAFYFLWQQFRMRKLSETVLNKTVAPPSTYQGLNRANGLDLKWALEAMENSFASIATPTHQAHPQLNEINSSDATSEIAGDDHADPLFFSPHSRSFAFNLRYAISCIVNQRYAPLKSANIQPQSMFDLRKADFIWSQMPPSSDHERALRSIFMSTVTGHPIRCQDLRPATLQTSPGRPAHWYLDIDRAVSPLYYSFENASASLPSIYISTQQEDFVRFYANRGPYPNFEADFPRANPLPTGIDHADHRAHAFSARINMKNLKISALPSTIGQCKTIESLDVSGSTLLAFPPEILRLPLLNELKIENCACLLNTSDPNHPLIYMKEVAGKKIPIWRDHLAFDLWKKNEQMPQLQQQRYISQAIARLFDASAQLKQAVNRQALSEFTPRALKTALGLESYFCSTAGISLGLWSGIVTAAAFGSGLSLGVSLIWGVKAAMAHLVEQGLMTTLACFLQNKYDDTSATQSLNTFRANSELFVNRAKMFGLAKSLHLQAREIRPTFKQIITGIGITGAAVIVGCYVALPLLTESASMSAYPGIEAIIYPLGYRAASQLVRCLPFVVGAGLHFFYRTRDTASKVWPQITLHKKRYENELSLIGSSQASGH